MSVIDILFRVDEICKKYEKYDVDKQKSLGSSSDDAFARLFASFKSHIDATLRKSEVAAVEKNRATVVALNAEVRRMKARLLDEVPKLQKLAQKKVKGITKEEQEARIDLVLSLPERIQAISVGNTQTGGWGASSSHKNIKFDSDGNFESDFFQQSEEGNQFRQEYEMRKLKQDQGLDVISDGLDVLKNLARDMNEELDRQVPLIDEIDTKVDKASSNLKNTNARLKETLFKYTEMNASEDTIQPYVLTDYYICIFKRGYYYIIIIIIMVRLSALTYSVIVHQIIYFYFSSVLCGIYADGNEVRSALVTGVVKLCALLF